MATILYLAALSCLSFGALGFVNQCKSQCNDIYNPECFKFDYCCDIHEALHHDSPCHNDKLKHSSKPPLIENPCCGNRHSHMFVDKCEVSSYKSYTEKLYLHISNAHFREEILKIRWYAENHIMTRGYFCHPGTTKKIIVQIIVQPK